MNPPPDQTAQDARVQRLWRELDVRGRNELSFDDLQSGLRMLDHPLKDAKALLKDVMKKVDTNDDGRIQYDEFRAFVEHTERQLYALFRSIDQDNDGRFDKAAMRTACRKAGLHVTTSKLDQFFEEVDSNSDGVISFEEWRSFLIFLPDDAAGLKTVLSYYSSTVSLNSEGDSILSDDTIQGLGISIPYLLASLFGSILQIARPPRRKPPDEIPFTSQSKHANAVDAEAEVPAATPRLRVGSTDPEAYKHERLDEDDEDHLQPDLEEDQDMTRRNRHMSLTSILPDPGYFLAGGVAGVISRTATAPLDRLKVHLIANTGSIAKEALKATKSHNAVGAVKQLGRPLIDAMMVLWKAGGWKGLFTGNGINVLKVMPESAIKFGSYEGAKRALAKLEGHGDAARINPYSKFVAGGVGGMISQLFVYPLDTLKFRMQCSTEAQGLRGYLLIKQTFVEMRAKGGFYRGLTMGLVGMFPYSAIDLGTFEFLKTSLITYNARRLHLPVDHPDCKPGSFGTGAIGAFSGSFGASIVYPVNLVRTRLQAQGTKAHPRMYTSALDCARTTIRTEGFKGLFKGITPNLLKVIPSVSITYVVYENAKTIMHLR